MSVKLSEREADTVSLSCASSHANNRDYNIWSVKMLQLINRRTKRVRERERERDGQAENTYLHSESSVIEITMSL